MRVVNFSEARNNLKTIIDQTIDDADVTVFNRLMETVHLLRSPANAAHLERSIAQYRGGKTKPEGLVNAD